MTDPADPQELIWQRLERHHKSIRSPESGPQAQVATDAPSQPRLAWLRRMRWRVLDLLGALFWLYWLTKILVADIDVVFLRSFAPGLVPLLEYRVVFYLGVLVIAAISWRRSWIVLLYVLAFPLVVLLWKVPLFLIRHRSWAFFLGVLQAASALFGDLRWNLATKSLSLIAAILIITTRAPFLLIPSAVFIAVLMAWSLVRRLRRIVSSPSFITVQQRTIRRVMASGALRHFLTLDEQYKSSDLQSYDATQASQVEMTISYGIALNKILLLWAFQLERYRKRYSPAVAFNLLTYAWVFIATLVGFSLLNLALLKLAPDEFAIDGPRPPIAVLLYSFGTFVLGEVGGIHPVGQLAYLLQLAAGLAGLLILAGLAANVVLSIVRERDETATTELINELRQEAQEQEQRFRDAYAISTDEAYERLRAFGAAAASLLPVFVRGIPTHEQ
jgi:hypothetical protein